MIITQTNFAQVFLQMYYKYLKPDNIKAGFTKCGLVNPDSPDYSKLHAAAAQREHSSTIFEGVDQGGYKEVSAQTVPTFVINRASQTDPILSVTTVTQRQQKLQFVGSMCDMVINFGGYAPLAEQYTKIPFTTQQPSQEFVCTPSGTSKQMPTSSPTKSGKECHMKMKVHPLPRQHHKQAKQAT